MLTRSRPNLARAVVDGDVLDRLAPDGSQREFLTVDRVDVAGQPFDRAVRVATRNGVFVEANAQLAAAVAAPIAAGDVLLATFAARCTESMTGEGQIAFAFELIPNEVAAELRVGVGGEWQSFAVPFRAGRDADSGRVCFRAGYDRQTVELGDVRVVNLGPDAAIDALPRTRLTYVGREPGAAWRDAAAGRIDRLRKGDLVVQVVDANGQPVAGATVDVALRRHAFGFGTAVDARLLTADSDDSERYRATIAAHFNRAVFENDMKWPAVHGGVPAHTDAALDWLRDRDIEVRGHNLLWPSWRWMPADVAAMKDRPDELRRATLDHIARTAAHFRGRLIQWDVVNEPFSEHDLIDALGGTQAIVEWFRAARDADPMAALYLNDYGIFDSGRGHNAHQDHFFETIRALVDADAPLDGIGIQSHFSSDLPSPDALDKTLDRFATFGLPIESTELSLNFDDEQIQADYLRDYLTTLFAHPRVGGVTLWGFWSGRHWRPAAGLWDRDWRAKPSADVLTTLLHETWSTRATLTTDARGVASVRGFCGAYDLAARAGDRAGAARVHLTSLGRPSKVSVA